MEPHDYISKSIRKTPETYVNKNKAGEILNEETRI